MNHWPTDEGIIRSLRTGKDSKDCWYPTPTKVWQATISAFFHNEIQLIDDISVRRNVAYNLQYVEYLEQTLRELSLSDVLEGQTIKSHVIVSVSVVECLLFHLNRAAGGKESDLFNIIDRISNLRLLGQAQKRYEDLGRFRKLRNKIHIYEQRNPIGTDYQLFKRAEFRDMRRILYEIATSSALGLTEPQAEPFEFLRTKVWSNEL
jgi:hypothetical protein